LLSCAFSAPAEVALTGRQIMTEVRQRLPLEPVRLTGFIRTREGRRNIDRALVSELRFGDPEPHMRFELRDHFGESLARARISWTGAVPRFELRDAEDEALPDAKPADEIADTGLSWSDLSLDFLWWEGAELTGRERVKTRTSHIVRIPAPPERPDLSAVRLWIDTTALFVVRAELIGPEGRPVKRIDVDSLVEIREGEWMVKDLIIRDYPHNRRMGVRFEEVEVIE
jgi:hypothetical protein